MRYLLTRARESSSQAAAGTKSWLRRRKGREREKDVLSPQKKIDCMWLGGQLASKATDEKEEKTIA